VGELARGENEERQQVIRIENLTRYYGKRLAVDDISFNVGQGEVVGFLGPNAAGKTTTMRIIAGCLAPTRGEVRVAGHDMVSDSLQGRRLIGYLPELVPIYGEMTTRAYLEFAARLRGIDKPQAKRRVDAVIAKCRLEEYADTLLAKLSKGFRQRVGLAQAIVHDPRVLILDEPTVGIDPIQVVQTRELIRELGREHTVLLSTHILSEVAAICERVIVIHQGKIVAGDRIENLASILKGGRRIRLQVQGPEESIASRLRAIGGVRGVAFEAPCHVVECEPDRDPRAEIAEAVLAGGWKLLGMESMEMSLEDIFLELTGEKDPK
jgi:ABC-2 type transport system ATP-binding protein